MTEGGASPPLQRGCDDAERFLLALRGIVDDGSPTAC